MMPDALPPGVEIAHTILLQPHRNLCAPADKATLLTKVLQNCSDTKEIQASIRGKFCKLKQ